MSADQGLSKKSEADLEAERQKVANELWEAKRLPKDDPRYQERESRRQQLEQRYNEIEKEKFTKQGNDPAEYKYKHDARHEFQFDENHKTGEKRAGMAQKDDGSGPYTLRKKDEVINWRADTDVGAKASSRAQQNAASRTGDDAGHLVGAEFGADPADSRNLTRQNLAHNERGAWYQQERKLRDDVEAGRNCGVNVSVKPQGERSSRTFETYDVSAKGERSAAQGGNVEYVDFSTKASRTYQEGKPTRAEALQARKDTHTHTTEVEDAVKNQNPAEVQAWRQRSEAAAAARQQPSVSQSGSGSVRTAPPSEAAGTPRKAPPSNEMSQAGPRPAPGQTAAQQQAREQGDQHRKAGVTQDGEKQEQPKRRDDSQQARDRKPGDSEDPSKGGKGR